jgi:hypothetical protein
MLHVVVICFVILMCFAEESSGGYQPVEHKELPPGAIPVDSPGVCDQAGKTYVLTRDIASPTTALFLAQNVTLDLNGHTISYADGDYEHVPNYGFEEGLKHWDFSLAPTAKTEDTDKVKPFIGRKILRLSKGEQIVSPYITLPLANRSYYAMCGVLDRRMKVVVSVEDESGQGMQVRAPYGRRSIRTCPQAGRTRLGGGFVFAWLHHLPAGKYRIRVTARTDALIDEVDIRPAMDVGVGIVGKVLPDASYRRIYLGIEQAAFCDYLKEGTADQPTDGIPHVTGPGKITIRNGIIKSGFEGIRSWGVQCTAPDTTVILENVKIVASGINTQAVNVHKAKIANCRFEIDTPSIIQRHRLLDSPVSLREADGSEISHCEFIGGQGNLHLKGRDILVHDNLFVNRQTVTNHYSIMLGACEGVKIYRNRFEPEVGSGITVYVSRNNEIYENTFKIVAANGNCEYSHEDYSTNAIRITDYNTRDSNRAGGGNRIHDNKFQITGKFYTNYEGNVPIVTALFCSVGGGVNYIYGNEIVVDHQALDTPAQACAFYIGGSRIGGEYYDNEVTTNVPAFWIANPYGHAADVKVRKNTIVKSPDAPEDFTPFRFGYEGYRRGSVAKDIVFEGNKFVDCEFGIQSTDAEHTYTRK